MAAAITIYLHNLALAVFIGIIISALVFAWESAKRIRAYKSIDEMPAHTLLDLVKTLVDTLINAAVGAVGGFSFGGVARAEDLRLGQVGQQYGGQGNFGTNIHRFFRNVAVKCRPTPAPFKY